MSSSIMKVNLAQLCTYEYRLRVVLLFFTLLMSITLDYVHIPVIPATGISGLD